MTREQINEADKAFECLADARKHLDRAMYAMGYVDVNDRDYKRMRAFYDAICRLTDAAVNDHLPISE